MLDRYLYEVLRATFDDAVAATHSWHSFRIGLACSLAAAGVNDETICMLCRWASPESLRLYRRVSAHDMMSYVDRAQKVRTEQLQMGNAPLVDASVAFARLHISVENERPARRARNSEAAPTLKRASTSAAAAAPVSSSSSEDEAPAADQSALTPGNTIGRRVLVPRAMWPGYPCDENKGAGWTALVVKASRGYAHVSFSRARDASGRRYANANVALDMLVPI
jgi:hypothetical protein